MDFSLSATLIIMNIAYLCTLIGLAVRNILILRILMISAQILLIYTGNKQGNPIVVFWNCVFLVINLYRIILLLLERRDVKIPAELEDIYNSNFLHMTHREFLKFWKMGQDKSIESGYVLRKNVKAEAVFIVIDGKAYVQSGINTVAILGRGDFIGEMSFLSGKPTSADVISDMPIRLKFWTSRDLSKLKVSNNAFWIKIQQSLGNDLVGKVHKSNAQVSLRFEN